MRQFYRYLLTGLALAASFAAAAQQSLPSEKERKLRDAITARTKGTVAVDDITTTPVPGLYAVASDGEVFYTDETGRYSFVNGALIDMQDQRDLTTPLVDKMHAIPFSSLPLKLAMKEVHGKGRRTMAIFEDPNCPICRVLTKFLDQVDDVTIYRFMYPVIDPKSEALARNAWCAADRSKAWKDIMNGFRPSQDGTCDVSGLSAILRFGEKYRIQNTPTVVLANGKRLVGATPPEQFLADLDAGGR